VQASRPGETMTTWFLYRDPEQLGSEDIRTFLQTLARSGLRLYVSAPGVLCVRDPKGVLDEENFPKSMSRQIESRSVWIEKRMDAIVHAMSKETADERQD